MSIILTPEPPPPSRRRGHPLIAWLFIAAAVALVLAREFLYAPPTAERNALDVFETQARTIVGAARLGPAVPPNLYDQAKELDRGPTAQRLRFVVVAGELKDADEAVGRLDELERLWKSGELEKTDDDERTAAILRRLYEWPKQSDGRARTLEDDDRRFLEQRLGWFGRLALAPASSPDLGAREAVLAPAQRAAVASLSLIGLVVAACVAALLLFVLAVSFRRHIRLWFLEGPPPGGVYAETFAVWFVLFIALGWASRLLPLSAEQPFYLLAVAGLNLASLAALAWPVLRGIPWREVRWDLGLDFGPRPVREPFCGLACYVLAVPLVVLAALAIIALMRLQHRLGWETDRGPLAPPGHPAAGLVLHSSWWVRIQLLFLASIVAPILEETMFRGVLFRHLRDATAAWGHTVSFVASAIGASFVFAIIHPQGLFGVPVLMALACGFAAAREWRSSLVGSMTAHGLHNAMLLGLTVLLAG
jgi:membrane protease YdiL (CAAX protease family)